jgi:DNA polymerase delta subunit 1
LAEKMKKRDAASAPNVGDRVAYVITRGTKGSKLYERSEDPIWVLQHDIALDFTYYMDNQIKLPLVRIFEPIFGDPKKAELALFSGEHTRNIYQPKVQASSKGGLGAFIKVTASCIGCNNPLQSNYDDVVCKTC